MPTKKVVAKAGTKKATKTTKKITSSNSKRVLARAEGSQCCWVNDGGVLSDLHEFSKTLTHMGVDTYKHHVNGTRNDFADWIQFVLGDTELADSLRGKKTQKQTQALVAKRLKIYELS